MVKDKKRGRIWKWLSWIVGILVLIACAALIFVNVYIGKSKPQIDGEMNVAVLDENVKVVRDDKGVPHVTAETDADLYRAQGFVQAQDRLFQMDLARRQASGRLAEVVGEAAVKTDKFFRTFSLRSAAEKSEAGYSKEAKQVLDWYAEGVNAFMEQAKEEGTLSYEFRLLGYEPEPWTAIDSLTIGKYMAYDLGGHWDMLAFRHWALNNLPEAEAKELFITYPEKAKSIIAANKENPVEVAGQFDASLLPHEFNGSNNWVVSGSKTASGKPLLADDPHLGLSTPSVWYQMHLESPTQNVSGVIFAGVPGIILGHNEKVAWGVTNVGPDVQDLYIETPNPNNATEFKYEGKWEKAIVRDEPIKIKGAKTVEFEVVETRHGPIISDLAFKKEKSTAVFSLQWTALEPTLELQAILNMNRAENWEQFETALEDFHSPAQNFVFAAEDGTIAYKANGRIPIRKKGDGQLPVPGDSADYDWKGYIDYDKLPKVVNPDEGFIATANNEVIGKEYPYHITDFWAQSYRYERIYEVLKSKNKLTVEDMQNLQMDQKDLYADEFLKDMLGSVKTLDSEKDYSDIVKMMEDWDQVDSKESGAPLVFNLWMINIQKALFEDSLPKDVYEMMPGKYNITDEIMRRAFAGKQSPWVTKAGGIDQLLYNSFKKTIKDIKGEYGKNAEKWQWGDHHQLTFDHPLSAASPILAKLLNPKPVPIGGSKFTVQAAASDKDGNVDHGASWRFVADLSDLSKGYHIVGPGQSGHMKSKWYHDQVDDWANGTYHETIITGDVPNGKKLLLKAQ
ncbi:penicillin acylase family protein [Viridibacillus sp. YIM B01967]|uniref:Penicillin acylase family protein n=1 Tax=Viridibacillus soli TaxID=2798301 RepID=A0ABS1H564_9BACL|nr:penicillin acylase family protein [Viridibacillus soli]MBK3494557.1 penicillin acylase family protein [Viridibacillus soli]